jgi:hypothetical protein
MHKLRLKVLAITAAAILAGVAVLSWSVLPVWPVVGIAVAAFAFAVNTIGGRLSDTICYGCGEDLKGHPANEQGVLCDRCGLVNPPTEPNPREPAPRDTDRLA